MSVRGLNFRTPSLVRNWKNDNSNKVEVRRNDYALPVSLNAPSTPCKIREIFMSIKEAVVHRLSNFDDATLRKVADYLDFLRYQLRSLNRLFPEEIDLATLYSEFVEEDRNLAEEGMTEYSQALATEDAQ